MHDRKSEMNVKVNVTQMGITSHETGCCHYDIWKSATFVWKNLYKNEILDNK